MYWYIHMVMVLGKFGLMKTVGQILSTLRTYSKHQFILTTLTDHPGGHVNPV